MAETPRPEQLPKLQPDRVKPLEFLSPEFQQLEDAAIHTLSTVAVAMDQYGNPLIDEGTTKKAIMQYYKTNKNPLPIRAERESELSTGAKPNGAELLYWEAVQQYGSNSGTFVEMRRENKLPMQDWKVDGELDPVLQELPAWNEIPNELLNRSSEQVRNLIKTHLEQIKGKFTKKDVVLYSPFFENPDDVNSQITVTQDIQALIQALEDDITALEQGEKPKYLEIFTQPVKAMVVNSFVRAEHLPTPVPFTSEQHDIGTGNSNEDLATTMKMAEHVVVRAQMGNMYYVEGPPLFNDGPGETPQPAVRGWVSATEIAQLQEESLTGMESVIYTEAPFTYETDGRSKTLRYGDRIFRDVNGKFHTVTKSNNGLVTFQALPDVTNEHVIEGVTTYKQVRDLVAKGMLYEGYWWGGHDCSDVGSEISDALGKRITEFSGTQIEQFAALREKDGEKQTGKDLEITSVEQLQAMEPGLYYADIQYPDYDDDDNIIGYDSTHIFLIEVPDLSHIKDEEERKQMVLKEMKAFSRGYRVLNDKGEPEEVWGSHECSGAALAIHVGKRDRKLRPVKI